MFLTRTKVLYIRSKFIFDVDEYVNSLVDLKGRISADFFVHRIYRFVSETVLLYLLSDSVFAELCFKVC